jgi:hypothetical protein
MGDKVKDLVSGYIEELAARAKAKDGPKMVTFSIRMSEREHARLIWLAKNLDTQKTPLAEKLLSAAVDEAIEQYAGWASEDPEEFLEEALAEIQDLEWDPKPHHGPKPPHHKLPGPGPKHPKLGPKKHHGPGPKHPK